MSDGRMHRIRSVAIIDTETTGTDLDRDRVIEVAAVVVGLDEVAHEALEFNCTASARVLQAWSTLVRDDAGPHDNVAQSINRITPEMIEQRGVLRSRALAAVQKLVEPCEMILAHQAEFDRGFLARDGATFGGKPWVCTMNDLAWPASAWKPGTSLVNTALVMGVGVVSAHGALDDCMTLARCLSRVADGLTGKTMSEWLARGLRPKATFQALVSFDDKDVAKEHGFKWEAATKRWLRTMAIEDVAALPFRTRAAEEKAA